MTEYYFLGADNQRRGPFSLEQLMAEGIHSETFIWKAGLPQWVPAKDIPEIAALLPNTTPPPPPHFQSPLSDNGRLQRPCPPTNLIWGILCTILCCLPLGVIAIYKSSRVETLYYRGEIEKAENASQAAANWCIASITVAVLLNLSLFSFVGLGQLALISALL